MSKYNITVTVKTEDNKKFPKDMELKDVLGEELEDYYDGWEHGTDSSSWYFTNVPENILKDVVSRATPYAILKLHTNEVK